MPGLPEAADLGGQHVRRHRDDRDDPALAGQAADALGRRDPVHHRHLDVHQHEIVAVALHPLDRFGAVGRDVDLCPARSSTERANSWLRSSPRPGGLRPAAGAASSRPEPQDRVLLDRGDRQRHGEPERGALPLLALDADRAPHQLDEPLADREAEAGAAEMAPRSSCRPG